MARRQRQPNPAFMAAAAKQTGPSVSEAILKQGRKSGQLNLSNRSLQVSCNEIFPPALLNLLLIVSRSVLVLCISPSFLSSFAPPSFPLSLSPLFLPPSLPSSLSLSLLPSLPLFSLPSLPPFFCPLPLSLSPSSPSSFPPFPPSLPSLPSSLPPFVSGDPSKCVAY